MPTPPRNPSESKFGALFFMATLGDINVSTLAFATAYLGTKVGSTFEVGLIGMAYGITYCLAPIVMGKLGDRVGRRPALIAALLGFIGVNVYMLAVGANHTPWTIILGNIFGGTCYGCFWPNYIAFISERAPPSANARVISSQNVAWSLGYMSGPLLTGILELSSIFWAFALMMACAGVQLGITWVYVPRKIPSVPSTLRTGDLEIIGQMQPEDPVDARRKTDNASYEAFLRVIRETPERRLEVLVALPPIAFAFLNQLFYAIFPNYAILPEATGGLGWAAWVAGFIIFSIGIGRTMTFYLAPRASRPDRTLAFSLLLAAITLLATGLVREAWVLAGIVLVYGLATGYIYCIPQVLTLLRSQEEKGSRAGLYESLVGLGFITAALFGGILGQINLTWPYFMGALLAGAFFVVILNMVFRKRKIFSPSQR